MNKYKKSLGSDKIARMSLRFANRNIKTGKRLPMRAPRLPKGSNPMSLPIMTGKSVRFKSLW